MIHTVKSKLYVQLKNWIIESDVYHDNIYKTGSLTFGRILYRIRIFCDSNEWENSKLWCLMYIRVYMSHDVNDYILRNIIWKNDKNRASDTKVKKNEIDRNFYGRGIFYDHQKSNFLTQKDQNDIFSFYSILIKALVKNTGPCTPFLQKTLCRGVRHLSCPKFRACLTFQVLSSKLHHNCRRIVWNEGFKEVFEIQNYIRDFFAHTRLQENSQTLIWILAKLWKYLALKNPGRKFSPVWGRKKNCNI